MSDDAIFTVAFFVTAAIGFICYTVCVWVDAKYRGRK